MSAPQKPKPSTTICGEHSTGKRPASAPHTGPNFERDPRTGILIHTGKGKDLPGGRVK